MPTCASELGSRGLKIGFSRPAATLRFFQSISIEAVRMRIAEFVAPAKKSMYTVPLTLPPQIARGPPNSRPMMVWRTVAPECPGPVGAATTG